MFAGWPPSTRTNPPARPLATGTTGWRRATVSELVRWTVTHAGRHRSRLWPNVSRNRNPPGPMSKPNSPLLIGRRCWNCFTISTPRTKTTWRSFMPALAWARMYWSRTRKLSSYWFSTVSKLLDSGYRLSRGGGSRFAGRILPVDLGIADACGRLVARSESMGRPIEPRDAFIAATAEVHGLTLVTRNASDFEATVKAIVTPWI
jgi:predicted nucleic acid-binding protein